MGIKENTFQNIVSWTILLAFATQLTACFNIYETGHLDAGLNSFIEKMEEEVLQRQEDKIPEVINVLTEVKHLQQIKQRIARVTNQQISIDDQWMGDVSLTQQGLRLNRSKVETWLNQIEAEVKPLQELIFNVSKYVYAVRSLNESFHGNSVLFFALHYYRLLNRSVMEAATPLMIAASAEELNETQEVIFFRNELISRYFKILGTSLIIDQDLAKVMKALHNYSQPHLSDLSKEIKIVMQVTESSIKQQELSKRSKLEKILNALPNEVKQNLRKELNSFQEKLGTATLLYTPGGNLSDGARLLTWVGNLTWGLVNSLIGLGIVIATMAVSPFTSSVDFPTFRLAKNKIQVYVDVSGMSPLGGKMSMGIWEFDNHAGYGFASYHEGAHALQSVMLGPLYLPTILVTYLISGFDQGLMEDWAWRWADWVRR